MSLEALLKNNCIEILPPTKNVAQGIKFTDYDGLEYYSAVIYEFRDIYIEEIGFLIAMSEQDLKNQLKKIYNCDYFMERNLKNFRQWYEKLSGKKLTKKQLQKISKKFY